MAKAEIIDVPGGPRLRARIFAGSVADPSGCWLWGRHIKPEGYGMMGVKEASGWKTRLAHRISYEVFLGPIPEGADLDHLCRTRHCVNPMHLEPVTRSVNLRRSPIRRNQNNAKTHCPQGHTYSGTNNRGERICHICAAAASLRSYHRSK